MIVLNITTLVIIRLDALLFRLEFGGLRVVVFYVFIGTTWRGECDGNIFNRDNSSEKPGTVIYPKYQQHSFVFVYS